MEGKSKQSGVRGWLKRKGGALNTWSRRWCVLTDKCLFIYYRDDDKKWQDTIILHKQIVVEPPVDHLDPKLGYFSIVAENDKSQSETLHLCAETEEEKKTWMHALKKALYADKGGALFSQRLEDILFWEKKQGRKVPYIVDECVEYLYKYGLDVEGLFRLPGRMSAIKDVMAQFEQGQKVKFEDSNTDVHVVASVLKAFLRELPDSIIPCTFFQKFMNIALSFMDGNDAKKEKCVDDLVEALKLIPHDNYVILKYICHFLREVGRHEDQNKMSLMSLGTVFGYNIIRHLDRENSQLFLCTADLAQNLVYMLLHYYDKVFMLEYSEQASAVNDIPTADLLCISGTADIPTVADTVTTPGFLADLEGIDMTPMSTTEGDSDAGEKKENVDLRKKSLHLSISEPGDFRGSTSNPSSPNSMEENPPVPPRRNKTVKLGRNRRKVEGRKPDGYVMLDGDVSPRTPESVNADDVVTALLRAKESTSSSPASTPTRHLSSNENELHDIPVTTATNSSHPPDPDAEVQERDEMHRDGKVSLSESDLSTQVAYLKTELASKQERYKKHVQALTAQLLDSRGKYEKRIETLQAEHIALKLELESKLSSERDACAVSVAIVTKLKEELHRYHMLYGELPS